MPESCVLIVDDTTSIRNLLAAILRQHHIECDVAEDGEVAIEKLSKRTYSLVLLDLMMPRVDGMGVIDFMRRSGVRTPVVVVTAAGPGRVAALNPQRVKAVLTKPFTIAQVVDTVSALCEA